MFTPSSHATFINAIRPVEIRIDIHIQYGLTCSGKTLSNQPTNHAMKNDITGLLQNIVTCSVK
jgi:hypothetical protein